MKSLKSFPRYAKQNQTRCFNYHYPIILTAQTRFCFNAPNSKDFLTRFNSRPFSADATFSKLENLKIKAYSEIEISNS